MHQTEEERAGATNIANEENRGLRRVRHSSERRERFRFGNGVRLRRELAKGHEGGTFRAKEVACSCVRVRLLVFAFSSADSAHVGGLSSSPSRGLSSRLRRTRTQCIRAASLHNSNLTLGDAWDHRHEILTEIARAFLCHCLWRRLPIFKLSSTSILNGRTSSATHS